MLKKYLLIILAFAFIGTAKAQTDLHWPAFTSIPSDWNFLSCCGIFSISIHNEIIVNPDIEIAAFMGETRMSAGTLPLEVNGKYAYYMDLYGFDNNSANIPYTFKLYDHSLGCELDLISPNDIVFVNDVNYVYGSASEPHLLNFIPNGNITFADANVKAICVTNWDTNGDGELSYYEAAAVTTLNPSGASSSSVFKGNTTITSFDELQYFIGLTVIDYDTFRGCTQLTSVVLPSTINLIRNHAFDGCSSLTSVNIPEGVTNMAPYTFTGCTSLPTITIPSTVTNIGNYCFSNCTGLTSMTVNATTPPTVAANGVFQNVPTNIPIYVPCGCVAAYRAATRWSSFTNIAESCWIIFADANVKTLCVANWDTNGDGELSYDEAAAVTTLKVNGTRVFYQNTTITSFNELQYFTGLTSIEDYTFYGCTNLASVTLPESITAINSNAFQNCASITAMTIPNSVNTIGASAFYGCTDLASINIPSGVTQINAHTFRDCSSLTDIILPDGLTTISMRAFNGCSSLTSINIPSNVTTMGSYVFMGCSSLTTANWPDGLSSVSYSAFNGCTSLTTITIPSSVTAIYTNAFNNCTGLTSMVVEATTPPTLGTDAFSGVPTSIPVYVPCESLTAYQAAEGWSDFTNFQGIDCPEETQEFSLETGWSWWSTYIEMNEIDGLQLLEDALGDNATQIKSQNRFLLYENNVWDGNLLALTNEQMYRLYTIADGGYAIAGPYADPAEHTVNLKKGWNWIGYVESTVMDPNTAMANLTTAVENDCLKSYSDFATYYEGYGWYGDLEVMEPGLGYMLRVTNRGSFTYASSDKSTVINSSHSNVNKYWNPVIGKFPDNMNVLAVIELDGNELRTENAELAAFDENGECRGTALLRYVEPIDRYVAFLTVYGEEGDALHFQVRHEDVTYQVNERLTMVVDEVFGKGTEPYKMTVKGAGIDEINASLNLYPNPVAQGQEVKIELPENMGKTIVEIIDVMGRTIQCNTVDGRDGACTVSTPGVYTIRVTDRQGKVWHGKLIVK